MKNFIYSFVDTEKHTKETKFKPSTAELAYDGHQKAPSKRPQTHKLILEQLYFWYCLMKNVKQPEKQDLQPILSSHFFDL